MELSPVRRRILPPTIVKCLVARPACHSKSWGLPSRLECQLHVLDYSFVRVQVDGDATLRGWSSHHEDVGGPSAWPEDRRGRKLHIIAYQDGGPSNVKASPRTPILYLSINILDIGGRTDHRKHPELAEQTPQLHMLKGCS
jgi:hypothetical protein